MPAGGTSPIGPLLDNGLHSTEAVWLAGDSGAKPELSRKGLMRFLKFSSRVPMCCGLFIDKSRTEFLKLRQKYKPRRTGP